MILAAFFSFLVAVEKVIVLLMVGLGELWVGHGRRVCA
jgi:hypothetical protein